MHFYRRKLPHWQHPEARYFIRFRLAGSLPKEATQKIKSQRKEIEKKSDESSQRLSLISFLRSASERKSRNAGIAIR